MSKHYVYAGTTVDLSINYMEAYTKFTEMNCDILSIFDPESTIIQDIMLNDKIMLDVRFYFLKRAGLCMDFEDALEDFTPEDMDNFREAFWQSVLNFSPPASRKALSRAWKLAKKQLADAVSMNSSLDSPEEQDSTESST